MDTLSVPTTKPPAEQGSLAIPLEHIILICGSLVFVIAVLALFIFICLLRRRRKGMYQLGGTQHLIGGENAHDNYAQQFDTGTIPAASYDELRLPEDGRTDVTGDVVFVEFPTEQPGEVEGWETYGTDVALQNGTTHVEIVEIPTEQPDSDVERRSSDGGTYIELQVIANGHHEHVEDCEETELSAESTEQSTQPLADQSSQPSADQSSLPSADQVTQPSTAQS